MERMVKFKTKNGNWRIDSPTIDEYYRIQNLLALAELDEVKLRIVVALSSAPEEEVRSMSAESFDELWSSLEQGPLSASSQDSFKRIIDLDGKKYGFINIADLSIGELADLDTIKNHPQSEKQLHRMMAILYRPLVSGDETKYEIEPHGSDGYVERADLFLEEMKIRDVLAPIDFFFHITRVCLRSMMDSLTIEMTEWTTQLKNLPKETIDQISRLQEDGQTSSTFLQTTTSLRSKSALGLESTESLTSSPIKKTKQNSLSSNTNER